MKLQIQWGLIDDALRHGVRGWCMQVHVVQCRCWMLGAMVCMGVSDAAERSPYVDMYTPSSSSAFRSGVVVGGGVKTVALRRKTDSHEIC